MSLSSPSNEQRSFQLMDTRGGKVHGVVLIPGNLEFDDAFKRFRRERQLDEDSAWGVSTSKHGLNKGLVTAGRYANLTADRLLYVHPIAEEDSKDPPMASEEEEEAGGKPVQKADDLDGKPTDGQISLFLRDTPPETRREKITKNGGPKIKDEEKTYLFCGYGPLRDSKLLQLITDQLSELPKAKDVKKWEKEHQAVETTTINPYSLIQSPCAVP